jgi:hypothetical protein
MVMVSLLPVTRRRFFWLYWDQALAWMRFPEGGIAVLVIVIETVLDLACEILTTSSENVSVGNPCSDFGTFVL